MSARPTPRRPAPVGFQPSFTLLLLYAGAFFLLWAFVLTLPGMLEALTEIPPDPENREIFQQRVRELARPRLGAALALSLLTTGLGSYFQVLPGLRGLKGLGR